MSQAASEARGWAFIAGFHVFCALVMAVVIASAPDPSGQVALIYSPFSTPAAAFAGAAASGGRIVRAGRRPWILVVAPDSGDAAFSAKARAGGAWLQLNPVVAGGCAPRRGANLARS